MNRGDPGVLEPPGQRCPVHEQADRDRGAREQVLDHVDAQCTGATSERDCGWLCERIPGLFAKHNVPLFRGGRQVGHPLNHDLPLASIDGDRQIVGADRLASSRREILRGEALD